MGISYKLENFEGPLDLLLHLIKEAKIEIKDIFVSEVQPDEENEAAVDFMELLKKYFS